MPKGKEPERQGRIKSLLYNLWAAASGQNTQGKSGEAEEQDTQEDFYLAGETDPRLAQQELDELEFGLDEAVPDENEIPAAGNALYELYTRRRGMPVMEDENITFHLSTFMEGEESPDPEQRGWLQSFEREARHILAESDKGEEKPLDAQAFVKIAPDKMSAWLFAFPPTFDGEPFDFDQAMEILQANDVAFGIDEVKLAAYCDEQKYFTLFKVASGMPPVDGKDGEIVDHFAREIEINLTVKDDNTVDYKDLGWLQTVNTDEVICDIVPPTDATSGMNVLGAEVKGRNGKKAVPPKGQNTNLNEEESSLLASIDGVVTFQAGRFRVDPLLIINGNVETATGNLEVIGDLLIHGDVLEGFTVEATGNITIQGMVEGATVIAGGDIQIGRGMNGNTQGKLQAKGQIRSKFIENANVMAGGKVQCDNIINSSVSSDIAIEVKTGRGAIIGGSITALERIDALSIGNQSNRSMIITLGSASNFLREKRELEKKQKELTIEVEELTKNLSFLQAGATAVTPQQEKTVDDMNLKLSVQKMQLATIQRKLANMKKTQTDNTKCRLRAEVIYPPVQINIGTATKTLRETAFNALVYLKEGVVRVANV